MKTIISTVVICFLAVSAHAAGSFVDYTVGGETFEGYYSKGGENAPLILLVHDWDGLTDYEVKRAEMLSERGYSVFAVDLFGKGIRPQETAEKRRLTGMLYGDRDRMRTLLNGGLAKGLASAGVGKERSVAIGYCFGGAAVLELARSGVGLKGFVSFHGGLQTPEGQNYDATTGAILVFHGSADTAVTLDQFADLAKQLEKAKVTHEMTTYSGAPHAFTVFGSSRYQEMADKKSWKRFLEFLDETF